MRLWQAVAKTSGIAVVGGESVCDYGGDGC